MRVPHATVAMDVGGQSQAEGRPAGGGRHAGLGDDLVHAAGLVVLRTAPSHLVRWLVAAQLVTGVSVPALMAGLLRPSRVRARRGHASLGSRPDQGSPQ
jgi:hypothetical protein